MIRKVAQRHLHNHDNWAEYYHGLVIICWERCGLAIWTPCPPPHYRNRWPFGGVAAITSHPGTTRLLPLCRYPVTKPGQSGRFIGTGRQASSQRHRQYPALQPSAQVQVLNLQYRASVILLNILKEHFNLTELQELCLEMEIDFDNLAGSSKADKARELLL